jgi:hypothetical protein
MNHDHELINRRAGDREKNTKYIRKHPNYIYVRKGGKHLDEGKEEKGNCYKRKGTINRKLL